MDEESDNADKRMVEMFHHATDNDSKLRIMNNLNSVSGAIRVLIATLALGMGVHMPDVRCVVVWGLPYSMLQLWQGIGRAGRNNSDALALIYVSKQSISRGCSECDVKCSCAKRSTLRQIISNVACIIRYILKEFDMSGEALPGNTECSKSCGERCRCSKCMCCTNCALTCHCRTGAITAESIINSITN